MNLDQRINAFVKLGTMITEMSHTDFCQLAESARVENPWFTESSVSLALTGIRKYLGNDKIVSWLTQYDLDKLEHNNQRNVGVVMAGNIPLAGFHDFLCVLLSGHHIQIKLSSKDSRLLTFLINRLLEIEPNFKKRISIQEHVLQNFDAVIATGSDNTARQFEYYFRNHHHIIRRNRTSVAILTGSETAQQLQELAHDIFTYFGLGCRNVSKIFVPFDYPIQQLFQHWNEYQNIIHHHKYINNYDYQKSILLVNKEPFLENGFLILQESKNLVSPISVLYFQNYQSDSELETILNTNRNKLQCIVGANEPATVRFGKAQYPEVWDYADNVDTMKFLESIG